MANSTNELDIELIKKRAIAGVVTFTLRTFFIQAFTFSATFILTILLAPQVFGIFFVVSAILNLFIYFSDVGLAAALIQKKEEPTRRDLVSTFTIQQIIVFSLVILGLATSSKIAAFYKLDPGGLMLLRVLIFSLILSSLKTIPSVLLERKLDFTRLIIPQIAENIVFYSTAVVLAYLNFGVSAFTWAVLSRGIVGLILIYLLSPWRPSLSINKESAKRLTSFGIPFQLNSILALLKDDLLIVVVGKILPFAQVGYIGWSQRFAFVPLRFVMDNLIKVTFPAYSRLQHDFKNLKIAIEKSLFFVTFSVYPFVVGLVAIAPRVINIVPNYQKWEPALPLLYFFAINAVFAAVNTTLTNTLFAMGKPSIILKLMVLWTTLSWILTLLFIKSFGFVGVAAASALVAMSTTIIVYFVKNEIKISVIKNIYGPILASTAMFLGLKGLDENLPPNVLGLILMIVAGIVLYLTFSIVILRDKLIIGLKTIIVAVFAK